MPTSLVVGASRGLGLELAKTLHSLGHQVIATVRSTRNASLPPGVAVLEGIDISKEDAGRTIVAGLGGIKLDLVIVNAGIFKKEVGRSAPLPPTRLTDPF